MHSIAGHRFFAGITIAVLLMPAVSVAADTPWKKMSPVMRTQAILNRARQDDRLKVGVECKVWVQNVVREASGGIVQIPRTLHGGEGHAWEDAPGISGACIPISRVRTGQIIQMRWTNRSGRSLPHTAIVLSATRTGVTVIDSNWDGSMTVRVHTWSIAEFEQAVGTKYTVYTVL